MQQIGADLFSQLPLDGWLQPLAGGGLLAPGATAELVKIWFGIVVCLMTTLGAVTPPIGVSCFVVAGMNPDADSAQVFRGAMRFLPAYLAVLLLLLLFPRLTVGLLAGLVH